MKFFVIFELKKAPDDLRYFFSENNASTKSSCKVKKNSSMTARKYKRQINARQKLS